jgi:hypothetical protein
MIPLAPRRNLALVLLLVVAIVVVLAGIAFAHPTLVCLAGQQVGNRCVVAPGIQSAFASASPFDSPRGR